MDVLLGLIFSFLWASASTAAKYSFQGQPPLTILSVRFAVAGALMMAWHYGLRRDGALPRGRQWGQLAIVGLTNSTLFLGAAWLGLREVPVGLYSLFLATMPFQVAILSRVWLGRQVTRREWLGIAVAAIGLAIVAAPSLARSTATLSGLLLVIIAMVSQAVGAVYLKRAALELPSGMINAWQLAARPGLSVALRRRVGRRGRPAPHPTDDQRPGLVYRHGLGGGQRAALHHAKARPALGQHLAVAGAGVLVSPGRAGAGRADRLDGPDRLGAGGGRAGDLGGDGAQREET
jgi:multidrug transporter EmrE-like cation transporter